MRIALLSYEYPPDTGFGGIGTYSYYQARALAKLGHEVHVFAGATTKGVADSEHDGVKVTRIKRESWLDRMLGDAKGMRAWWFQNRLTTAYNAYKILRREHDRKPFDFVEAPECGGDSIVSTSLLQVPTAVKFHSPARLIMNIYNVPKIDRELTAFAEQLGINQAEVLTSCSRFLADEVALRMHEPKPIHVVPNGIDVPMFDRDDGIDVYERFGLPRQKQLIFFANRMEERKGIHIVQAMVEQTLAQYPDIAFVFAGGDVFGYMEKRILPWVRDKGLQDRFFYLGKLSLPEVRACLKASSIFLIPSLWENCPYSCLEAMTAGRAIVSSDCGGMPELIADRRTGLLARNGDPASFVVALREMIEDPALRARCGAAARAEVEQRLTDTKIAQQSVDVFEGFRRDNPVATESSAQRTARAQGAAAAGGATAGEVAELKARLGALQNELTQLKGRREWRWGSALVKVATLGRGGRRG
ncbi:MAG: glycosyltransferase family 4 protein [Planctomycetes bacterium]|nr:glycosyltransferase family 4 protein [Planctomycetota bacterium]